MTSRTQERPRQMMSVARMWIVVGSFMIVSGAAVSLQVILGGSPPPMGDFPAVNPIFQFMEDHCLWMTLPELFIGIASIVAGVELLRLRAWARAALEAISWLGVLWVTAGASLYIVGVVFSEHDKLWLTLVEVLVLVITTACFIMPLRFCIRSLRSRQVHDAIVLRTAGGP